MNLWNRWDCGAKKNSFPSLMTEQEQNKKNPHRRAVQSEAASPCRCRPFLTYRCHPSLTCRRRPSNRCRLNCRCYPSLSASPIQPALPLPTGVTHPASAASPYQCHVTCLPTPPLQSALPLPPALPHLRATKQGIDMSLKVRIPADLIVYVAILES
jgi:hypothetical protein